MDQAPSLYTINFDSDGTSAPTPASKTTLLNSICFSKNFNTFAPDGKKGFSKDQLKVALQWKQEVNNKIYFYA